MLAIGRLNPRDGGRWNRRQLLEAGSLSVLGWTLADWLRAEPIAQRQAPAKSVILLWLWGGPSHLDTFDMKPEAPVEYRGPYRPVATNVPGVRICELLPQLARRADQYTILRSLHCNSNDHGIAGTIGLTASDAGAVSLSGQVMPGSLRPTHGSVVSRVFGFDHAMPGFLTLGGHLHQGHRSITGEGGGTLGRLYDPFRLDYDAEQGVRIPRLQLHDGLTRGGIDAREQLRQRFGALAKQLERSAELEQLDQFYRQAFSLLTNAEARRVFDVDREPEEVRRRYGRFRFGQCCLLARRLVEAGARFVQVNWSSHVEPVEDTGDGGWDMHDRNFQQFQDRHAWMLDQALAALLDDLGQRGLLDETIVVAVGEFGRTPKINGKAGRDHWNQCYSGLVAGGGTRAGQVIGASDARGEYPATRPLTPADLFTTVFAQLGIRSPQLTGAGLLPLGEVIEELV